MVGARLLERGILFVGGLLSLTAALHSLSLRRLRLFVVRAHLGRLCPLEDGGDFPLALRRLFVVVRLTRILAWRDCGYASCVIWLLIFFLSVVQGQPTCTPERAT